ncbi:hypothetical protein J8273_2556 [Carpediemonas membranifera]|uniref:Transmembrane protein 231 n=1 Tax=Carpediemonas membranifera TaxID=201153 RepID=A0A8J6E1D3_9EUKA|nr:hypothetical protein J8273_2556 [Carpediemonas membranifera]|eukprot:KAG9396204.1 hypothetical protein J8273_2556 [Carpediemonas membranifera]
MPAIFTHWVSTSYTTTWCTRAFCCHILSILLIVFITLLLAAYGDVWDNTATEELYPTVSSDHELIAIAHLSDGSFLGCSTSNNIARVFDENARPCTITITTPNATLGYSTSNLTISATIPVSSSVVVGLSLLSPLSLKLDGKVTVEASPVLAIRFPSLYYTSEAHMFGTLEVVQRDSVIEGQSITIPSAWPQDPLTALDVDPVMIMRAELANNWTTVATNTYTHTRTGPGPSVTATAELRLLPATVTYTRGLYATMVHAVGPLAVIFSVCWIVIRGWGLRTLVLGGYLRGRPVRPKNM